MSLICTEVENPSKWKPIPRLRVTIDPTSTNQLPFPSDYKYFSCLLPQKFMQCIDRVQNFKIRPDDIWILGFPKSGKTNRPMNDFKLIFHDFKLFFFTIFKFFQFPTNFLRKKP